jgi:hypothetical protein
LILFSKPGKYFVFIPLIVCVFIAVHFSLLRQNNRVRTPSLHGFYKLICSMSEKAKKSFLR